MEKIVRDSEMSAPWTFPSRFLVWASFNNVGMALNLSRPPAWGVSPVVSGLGTETSYSHTPPRALALAFFSPLRPGVCRCMLQS